MNEEYRRYNEERIDWWQLSVVVMFMLMFMGIMVGCKTTKYVSVPEYHTEYIVRSDTISKVDSVMFRDSVYIYNSGDTIIINKIKYRDRVSNVYKTRTDTIRKTDSIRVPYPVERELTKSEQRYLSIGKDACKAFQWLLVAAVIAFLAWFTGKIRNK